MDPRTPQAPSALLVLPAHAPAPARVELVYVAASWRISRALLSAVFFWGIIPLVMWVPPHYPWVLACIAAGTWLPWYFWTGRYRVRAFAGACPRCEEELSLTPGTRIDLPHALTCFHCHFEPRLEMVLAPADGPGTVAHRSGECVGVWRLHWLADERFLVCDGCRAHYPATPEATRAAREENERGALLRRLTGEGNILP